MTHQLLCALAICAISGAGAFCSPLAVHNTLPSQQRHTKLCATSHDNVGRESKCITEGSNQRRSILAGGVGVLFAGLLQVPMSVDAAVTDETNTFANIANDSAYRGLPTTAFPNTSGNIPQSQVIPSDELVILIPKASLSKGLGIELGQVDFRTNIRVFVKSVLPGSVASTLGIQKDWVVVAINGKSTERTNAEGVAMMVSQAAKSTFEGGAIEVRFRDASIFRDRLNDLSSTGQVTTQVAPAGDTTQRNLDGSVKFGRGITDQTDQRFTVTQLVPPKMCRHGATTDDLLEISYLGTVVETGAVFDGSAISINGDGIPGRGNDVSLFFVLGKQPFGQFPPGWDVGLEGICVGERRRLIIPPVLAYGANGLPRRGIPPNATLQYDITLVSINGLATPQ